MKKKIILTGGGTAGHVTPNLALVPTLKKQDFDILYVGSYNGMEKDLVEKEGLRYLGISSGKLRRYFDLKNFTDPFRVIKGYFEARSIIKREKPDVIFSKGGFVAVPVVLAAHHTHVPVISHESDLTPGLANRIALPFSDKICCNFPETLHHLPDDKAVLTGSPIRSELLTGNRQKGLDFAGFSGKKPILMVIGGSLGSVTVNCAVRSALPQLLPTFDVIHLCGKGNLDSSLESTSGYIQFEYIREELKDLFAAADVIISRAGANAICELLALKKPNILIPLSAKASRGDQILNANSFKKQGFSCVLDEDTLSDQLLVESVNQVYDNRENFIAAMSASKQSNGVEAVISVIQSVI